MNFAQRLKRWLAKPPPVRKTAGCRLIIEELEPRILLSGDYYRVPGARGQPTLVHFDWTQRDAGYNNEIGVYAVQNRAGKVAGLLPGDRGYAATVRAHARVVFASGQGAGAHREFNFAAGTLLAFYMVQHGTTVNWAAQNPNNRVGSSPASSFSMHGPSPGGFDRAAQYFNNRFGVSPVGFFSVDGASPDGFDHVRSQNLGHGAARFYWEDRTGGGDRDFNDCVFEVGFTRDHVLHVPGRAGQTTTATFTLDRRHSSHKDEFGIFRVDDVLGHLGGLRPGDAGYAAAAMKNAIVVFRQGGAARTHSLELS